MENRRRSSGHLTVRSSRTPLIQVTIPNVPDENHDESSSSTLPHEGVDNPTFHMECVTPTLTPQPNQHQGSPMFVFDPDCASLYSRIDSEFSRRGSSAVDDIFRRGSSAVSISALRTPVSSFGGTPFGTPLTAPSDKSSLTVPTITTKFHGSDDSSESGNELKPGDSISRTFIPPPSPGMLSTNSQWSDLVGLGQSPSRQSSLSVLTDRVSNVSSSLSDHLRYLVRAFSSRTEKVKETTVQPPSPSSLSEYENSDNISGISGDHTQIRHRLDSFFPPEPPEEDSGSDQEIPGDVGTTPSEKRRKFPRWLKKIKMPHVLDPHSKIYLLWLFIVTLAFMYNAYGIPLRAVFPYQTDENVHYWLLCDYFCDFIYIVDILVFKVRISYLNSGLKEMSRRATRNNYMKKRMFKFDCACLLPLDLFYLVNMKVNPWLRLPRLLKIQTFWEFYSRCDHLVKSAHSLRIVKTMTYMLFLIHIETCGYYAVSVYEGIGTNEWVFDGVGNAYIRCFYLATKTATSIGNNPTPTNELEYMFMTVYWVSGVFVFALLIGQIRDIVDAANLVKTVYNKRMDAALTYVKSMNLPQDTQNRVRTWFIYNWQQQKVIDERQLMDALPKKLRTDLAIHVHFNTLSKVKLFQDCDKNLLYDLVLKLKPILYLPGDYVCKKGEIGKEMYIVSQGIVEVVGGPENTLVLATLREGSVFGEISLLAMAAEGNRRTADVRCKGFTNLFILSKNEFEGAMKDYPDAHKLLKKRANKLLKINARLQKKSQCSDDKIKAEEIIKSPPGTPKMVKAVIQVMDPGSSLVRHMSMKAGGTKRTSLDRDTRSVMAVGKDNKGYDNTTDTHENLKVRRMVKRMSSTQESVMVSNAALTRMIWLPQRHKMDLVAREPVFRVSDKASLKPFSSATEIEISPNEVKTNEANLSHTPTMQEIEDFFDEILTKTYEQEQILKEKANDAIKDNPNEPLIQEKKDSTCSQSSSDSGVQDTKTTSPAPSTSRTISNKDSKESFISTELGDILESEESDEIKPTIIEHVCESPEEYQKHCELHDDILKEMEQELYFDSFDKVTDDGINIENDQNTSSNEACNRETVVNGITYTVESLDRNDSRITRSLSNKNMAVLLTQQNLSEPKTLIEEATVSGSGSSTLFSSESVAGDNYSKTCKLSSIEEQVDIEEKNTKNLVHSVKVKPALPPKPAHLLRRFKNKNKFGLKINTGLKDGFVSNMPHVNEIEKSSENRTKDNKKGNSRNSKTDIKKIPIGSLQYNDNSIIVEEETSIVVEEDTASFKSESSILDIQNDDNLHPHHGFPPLISVQAPSTDTLSSSGSGFFLNKVELTQENDDTDLPHGNQVTCTAEVHREKTLSPPSSASEVQSPRRRKISVVSKDEVETFV